MTRRKSSEYGKTIWVSIPTYNQIQLIVNKSIQSGQKTTPGDVIDDLLALIKIPRYLMDKMKKETDPVIKKTYQKILQYMISQRVKKNG